MTSNTARTWNLEQVPSNIRSENNSRPCLPMDVAVVGGVLSGAVCFFRSLFLSGGLRLRISTPSPRGFRRFALSLRGTCVFSVKQYKERTLICRVPSPQYISLLRRLEECRYVTCFMPFLAPVVERPDNKRKRSAFQGKEKLQLQQPYFLTQYSSSGFHILPVFGLLVY